MNSALLTEFTLGQRTISAPVFFPSISSLKTHLTAQEHLGILLALRGLNDQFLVSAFDIKNAHDSIEIRRSVEHAYASGTIVLLDSGNYESYWREDTQWCQNSYHEVLSDFPCSAAFSFDNQRPPSDFDCHVRQLVSNYLADVSSTLQKTVIVPIIHGSVERLPILCEEVVKKCNVQMVAIPERCLGGGIVERLNTAEAIRARINTVEPNTAIHLLGTGHPISIALYTNAGVNSFDGLDWCRTVVDHDSGFLHAFSHADFFRSQTEYGVEIRSFEARTFAHNLSFYREWMLGIQSAVQNDHLLDFCRMQIPEIILDECERIFRNSTC